MRVTNMRRGLVALITAVLLTGCSANGEVNPFDLTLGDMGDIACAEARDARESLNEALDAPEDSGQRRGVDDWGLDPSSEEDIKQTIAELDERIDVCDNGAGGVAAEPSESPSASPSESPSEPADTSIPTEEESSDEGSDTDSDNEQEPADIVGWDQLVEDMPQGLEGSVEDHASETGFNWSDVETWAEASMPQGKLVDARVAVVFGRPGLTDAEVREQTDVAPDVPVVRAERCYTDLDAGNEVCLGGDDRLGVILAPVVMDGDTVEGLQPESGVLLTDGFPLVTYDLR